MKNCKVEQYKKVVNNANLPVFNSLIFDVDPGKFGIILSLPIGATVKCNNVVDNIYVGSGSITPITFPWVNSYDPDIYPRTFINGTLTKKTRFIAECRYTTRMLGHEGNTIHITDDILSSISKNVNLTYISLTSTIRDNTILILPSDIKNNNITHIYMTGDIFGGNISEMGRYTKLTNLSIQRNTNLTGTVENFVSVMVTAGRTSGTIETDMRYTGITFNSKAIQDYTNTYLYITFDLTGATVEDINHTLLGTYANSTWSYA